MERFGSPGVLETVYVIPPPAAPVCSNSRSCPICHIACPGECIYSDIMQSVNLGVAVFDLKASSLLFLNAAGQSVFAPSGRATDFELLRGLLFPPGVPPDALPPEYHGESVLPDKRIVGYTLYGSGSLAWAFFRDITEKTRLESIAEAVEMMNNIGYVFSAVRHELGNPINSVKAGLSVLRANIDTFSRSVVIEYVDRLSSELSRVEVLLRSLRNFSMYEHLDPVPVDLHQFFEDFAALAELDLNQRGVRLSLTGEPGCVALADPRALQQALLNLIANAVDAVEGRPGPEISLDARCHDGLAHITVRDNGVGMSAEQTSAAFKPFHTTKTHGTGLGLVITRKLLLKMGGTVTLDSREGEGTTVHLCLSLAPRLERS